MLNNLFRGRSPSQIRILVNIHSLPLLAHPRVPNFYTPEAYAFASHRQLYIGKPLVFSLASFFSPSPISCSAWTVILAQSSASHGRFPPISSHGPLRSLFDLGSNNRLPALVFFRCTRTTFASLIHLQPILRLGSFEPSPSRSLSSARALTPTTRPGHAGSRL
jgi:hypothetical protein